MNSKNKKIAIQVFGHLRTFENTYQSLFENVILPNEEAGYVVHVFIHTWDELEYKNKQWHNEAVAELRGSKLSSSQRGLIESLYSPKKIDITEQLQCDDETYFDEFTGGKTSYESMRNVWFTKFRVNQLRLEYEKSENIEYDYVLNIRPDILLKNELSIRAIMAPYANLLKGYATPENKLFFSGHYRENLVMDSKLLAASDIIYFGTPDVMNKVANIYPDLDKSDLGNHFKSWEQFLIYTAEKNNIVPIRIDYHVGKDWKILRLSELNSRNSKKKVKMLSLRIRKYHISLILWGHEIKLNYSPFKR
jgi:hypothetical protein